MFDFYQIQFESSSGIWCVVRVCGNSIEIQLRAAFSFVLFICLFAGFSSYDVCFDGISLEDIFIFIYRD